MWQQVEGQANRYVWSDFHPRLLLLVVGDGSLIEVSGLTMIRYPVAHIDGELGLIVNDSGAWVCVDTDWVGLGGDGLWDVMEQISDSDHPFWAGPDVVKQEPTWSTEAAVLAEIRDTEDPDRNREATP
jgi:hypothetical protein